MSKVTTMRDAIATLVHDGQTIALEGFTHLISFAASHEIIRQGRRDLTLCRLTPDLVCDQLVGAGAVSSLVASWMGNPGAGSLYAVRRALEGADASFRLEEYSHMGMVGRYVAGAARMPFFPIASYAGSDLPSANPNIRVLEDPFGGAPLHAVPPLNPDLAIIHVQRSDDRGNAHLWGIPGMHREAAHASRKVLVVCEEIVPTEVIRDDPNRTIVTADLVDAVVCEPYGCHPSYAQGYYDRDNDFYRAWGAISRDPAALERWLDEWVHGCADHRAYVDRLGGDVRARLAPGLRSAAAVSYGSYR